MYKTKHNHTHLPFSYFYCSQIPSNMALSQLAVLLELFDNKLSPVSAASMTVNMELFSGTEEMF